MSSRDKNIQLAMEAVNVKFKNELNRLNKKIDHTETYLLLQIDQLSQRLDEVLKRVNQLSFELDSVIDDLAKMKVNVDGINNSLDNLLK